MPLGFTFTGDSLSPSSSGPANSGLGISIQGITTGGYSSGSAGVPITSATAGMGGLTLNPTMLLLAGLAVVGLMLLRRR